MLFVGMDLHKKSITVCVVNQERTVIQRRTFACASSGDIRQFFAELGPFQAVVEATASYEWLWQLLDMIPEAYRPTPRQRQHRRLLRQRCFLRRRASAARVKIRQILADYNADRADLFTSEGQEFLTKADVSPADRFVLDQLTAAWEHHCQQLVEADQRLRAFGQQAPAVEAEARAVLQTIPGIGRLTADVVLSEIGDIRRFRSAKEVMAYAGLVPG